MDELIRLTATEAVAKQYGMQSIPHFKVFGPDGKLQAEGKPARELVTGWFEE